ncbi:MAG: nitroreductase family protein [Candidatus Micrarchaeota archaeon]
MDVAQASLERRSVRAWKNKPIPEKAVGLLKKAVEWAPSAGGLQSRFFYFVFNKKKIAEICAVTGRQFPPVMPLLVVACADLDSIRMKYPGKGEASYVIMDVSASVENLLLQAHALGLGAVWTGAFDERKAREILSIPPRLKPVVVIPVGYPAEKPKPHERKKVVEEVR